MLHNVVSLADITSANGRHVDRIFTNSSGFEGSRKAFKWPCKHHVSSRDFTTWRKALEYIFPNEYLPTALGPWILEQQTDWLHLWDWFATTDGQFLYFRNSATVWHRFLRLPNQHHSYFSEFLVEETPTVPLHRATIEGDVEILYPGVTSQHYTHSGNLMHQMRYS